MTSQINPNNIDAAYPVAGQDNNTAGFRTNFSNKIVKQINEALLINIHGTFRYK